MQRAYGWSGRTGVRVEQVYGWSGRTGEKSAVPRAGFPGRTEKRAGCPPDHHTVMCPRPHG
ncbi:Hypothetical protein SCLAV_p1318 (plasmid) [Streptomyces clavuligerus]|uniref:Uncharacterized protein n=1 Tax=Streptomyces clavuligerus TaxID=1901 RepID=D5SLL1_STRCL|nr:Hypothetical protein SCLAV_p1318 [Streptomyces clavuligerus]